MGPRDNSQTNGGLDWDDEATRRLQREAEEDRILSHAKSYVRFNRDLDHEKLARIVRRPWTKQEQQRLLVIVKTLLSETACDTLPASVWRMVGSAFGRSEKAVKKAYLILTDERYFQGEKTQKGQRHSQGLLKGIAQKAMARLGGIATA